VVVEVIEDGLVPFQAQEFTRDFDGQRFWICQFGFKAPLANAIGEELVVIIIHQAVDRNDSVLLRSNIGAPPLLLNYRLCKLRRSIAQKRKKLHMGLKIDLLKKYWQKPSPNVEKFKKVILRENIGYLPFAELSVDQEVMKFIMEKYFDRKWVKPGGDIESQKLYWKNFIYFYYKMGYDYVSLQGGALKFPSLMRKGKDTASLSNRSSYREWAPSKGVISSWEDFEKYPWPEVKESSFWFYEFVSQNLPEGMGILACPLGGGVLEFAMNVLVGLETLSYLLYDNPKLVEAIFERIGEIMVDSYKLTRDLDRLVGYFQGDDMGHRTGTLISPDLLRKYILPYHKKAAELAHQRDLVYILHSCGNVDSIMEDLIENVKIDAKHSFEDTITPVSDFKKKFGKRISVVGGVDMNKLASFKGEKLRRYIRGIIEECAPSGGYLLGSGNTVANYIPVENYFLMMEEGLKWRNEHKSLM